MTGSRLGKYEILGRVTRRGSCQVFKGRDLRLGQLVAIKVCLTEEPEVRRAFRREVEIVSGLNHPQIPAVYASDVEGDTPFLVQEYLDGENLDRMIRRASFIDASDRLGLLRQVAEALRYIHSQGVIHRDLHPANVRIEDSGQVWLIDFGIAYKQVDHEVSNEGWLPIGTPGYIAPEQVRGATPDPSADLFSFGVLVYELVTGRRCFSSIANISGVTQVSLSPLIRAWPDCPSALVKSIQRCLHEVPTERYRGFNEIISSLDQATE